MLGLHVVADAADGGGVRATATTLGAIGLQGWTSRRVQPPHPTLKEDGDHKPALQERHVSNVLSHKDRVTIAALSMFVL
jgi:hypothetical protein